MLNLNLKENRMNLQELNIDDLYYGKAYIYTNEKSASLHLTGHIICNELPPESKVFMKYLYPNHLFVYLNQGDEGGLKITNIKDSKIPKISISLRSFSKFFDLEPRPPTKEGKKHSGVVTEILPYKYDGINGWLINIEEFQPKISTNVF
jgi:hypothetical protein